VTVFLLHPDLFMPTRFVTGALLSLTLLGLSCGGGSRRNVTVRGEDNDVRHPGLRASFNLRSTRADPRRHSPEGAEYTIPLALDVEYTTGSFETDGQIGVAEAIRFGGEDLIGPTTYETDGDLDLASVACRSGFRFTNGVSVEGYVGLGHSRLDMLIETPTERAHDRITSLGPILGARLSFWLVEEFALYGDLNRRIGIPRHYDELEVDVAEVGLRWWFKPPLGLFAGWRWVEYDLEDDSSSGRSDLSLDFAGPLFGLNLSF
jgi:hypothetical protein